jgi:hypothetical protein
MHFGGVHCDISHLNLSSNWRIRSIKEGLVSRRLELLYVPGLLAARLDWCRLFLNTKRCETFVLCISQVLPPGNHIITKDQQASALNSKYVQWGCFTRTTTN